MTYSFSDFLKIGLGVLFVIAVLMYSNAQKTIHDQDVEIQSYKIEMTALKNDSAKANLKAETAMAQATKNAAKIETHLNATLKEKVGDSCPEAMAWLLDHARKGAK